MYSATQPFFNSVITQRWGGALRDDTKNGYAADYSAC